MKIRVKILLTILLLLISYCFVMVMEQYVIPQNSADLAISQFKEDGSREQMRIQELSQNWLRPVVSFIYIVILIILWKKEFVSKLNCCSNHEEKRLKKIK